MKYRAAYVANNLLTTLHSSHLCSPSIVTSKRRSTLDSKSRIELFVESLVVQISQIHWLESQSRCINGSMRSDSDCLGQVIESYIAVGQYVWELTFDLWKSFSFSKCFILEKGSQAEGLNRHT